jgi:hypothetical protein
MSNRDEVLRVILFDLRGSVMRTDLVLCLIYHIEMMRSSSKG